MRDAMNAQDIPRVGINEHLRKANVKGVQRNEFESGLMNFHQKAIF